ncbi:MAG TPA: Uma2 family endonuclease [Coleofasciculaceae cyanobacterium]
MLFPSFFRNPKQAPPTEKRTILTDISWQKFEDLLVELGAERQTRLTYFRGKLELMTPIAAHERCNKLIESLILILVEELHLPVSQLMPILLKAPELGCAVEPDACYYFHTAAMQGQIELHLPPDPPPDLLVEVALTKSNLDKLPLYATLGIPEVWRYITTPGADVLKGQLLIYQLQDHHYIERQSSLIFPFLPASRVLQFLEASDSMSLATAIRLLRAWIKENQP